MRVILKVAFAVVGIFVAIELALWASRVADIPLYSANDRIGYVPRPNQSGHFLWTKGWNFNELSMGTARPFRPSDSALDVLLVGDSVVHGNNANTQQERLGPTLERQTGWKVWPISAPSWGLQNQLTYLSEHPEVIAGADKIIFIVNVADFIGPSSWTSNFSHPLKRPFPISWFLVRKYMLPRPEERSPTPVQRWDNLSRELSNFVRTTPKPIELLYYTGLGDHGLPSSCESLPMVYRSLARWRCVPDSPRWNAALYQDGFHPNGRGTEVLASIVASR